jgi:hypothetical protein
MQNAPLTGRLAGLDVQRLKRMVVVMWRAGRGDTLVKIVPRGQVPDSERMIGYCTTLKYVVGRTPEQMESILGFRAGTKLQNGADIYRVCPLPAADQFEFRAYTHLPGGVPQIDGRVVNPLYPPGAGAPQWDLTKYPQSGLKWLATVQPGQRFVCDYNSLPEELPVFMEKGRP